MRSTFRSIQVLFCFLAIALSSAANADDMNTVMQGMFQQQMSNYSPGGAYEAQTRGIIAGPSLYTRNKVSKYQVMSFTPPRFKASCSGIDIFTGAFSFISADQLVNMLRNIAANAVPYAFKMALSSLCPKCEDHMAALQNLAQKVNSMNIDSCQRAQQIMNNFQKNGTNLGPLLDEYEHEWNSLWGVKPDAQGSKQDPKPASTQAAEANPVKALEKEINIGWKVLTNAKAPLWYSPGFAGSHSSANEVILSFTGTYIRRYEDIEGSRKVHERTIPSTISIDDFMNGGKVVINHCDEATKCLKFENDPTTTETIKGFRVLVREILFGTGGGTGIVKKISTGVPFTDEEKTFIEFAPGAIYAKLRSLATKSRKCCRICQLGRRLRCCRNGNAFRRRFDEGRASCNCSRANRANDHCLLQFAQRARRKPEPEDADPFCPHEVC